MVGSLQLLGTFRYSLFQLLVDLLQLLLLFLEELLARLERLCLRLELVVGFLQFQLLLQELLGLGPELFGEGLRLIESFDRSRVGADHVQDDADAPRELLEEDPMNLAERLKTGKLDDRTRFVFEDDGDDEDVERRGLPEPEIAAVPTFQPKAAKPSGEPAPKTSEEEAAEDSVRRMVEAAYT